VRIIPFIIYLLIIALFKVILQDLTTFYGIGINITALLVMIVAIYKSEIISLWFGFIAGLVLSAGSPHHFGAYVITTAALGIVTYHSRERLNLDSLYSRLLLILFGVIPYSALILLINNIDGFGYLFITNILPSAIYTTLIVWIFFLIKEDRITLFKIKSLF